MNYFSNKTAIVTGRASGSGPIAYRKYTLEELLAAVTKRNIHSEIDTGPSVGKESW